MICHFPKSPRLAELQVESRIANHPSWDEALHAQLDCWTRLKTQRSSLNLDTTWRKSIQLSISPPFHNIPQLSAEPQWKSATWPEQQFRPARARIWDPIKLKIFERCSCHLFILNISKCYQIPSWSHKSWYNIQNNCFNSSDSDCFSLVLTSEALTNSPEIVVVLFTNRDGSNAIGVHIPDSAGKHNDEQKTTLVDSCLKPMEWVMSSLDSGTKWMRPASINWFPGFNFNQLHQTGYMDIYTIEFRMT